MSGKVRMPAVAGKFYPGNPELLNETIHRHLDSSKTSQVRNLKAIIVPHAGYKYSGPVAASAYSILGKYHSIFKRVVIIGPSHRARFEGLALSSAEHFQTPLGQVAVDQEVCHRLAQLPFAEFQDSAHEFEHSLEVHVPFLQKTLAPCCIVPILTGKSNISELASVIEKLWTDDETLIVVSTDLSHFQDHRTACSFDEQTCEIIESFQWHQLDGTRACGFQAVSALLEVARQHEMQIRRLDLRTSADVSGQYDRVVGYGAFAVFRRERADSISAEDQQTLFEIAKHSLLSGCRTFAPYLLTADDYPAHLHRPTATFVTLRCGNTLRGCTGTLQPIRGLAHDVAINAFSAGFKDPRFEAIKAEELSALRVSISILGPMFQMYVSSHHHAIENMRPGIEGYVLSFGDKRGVLLPSVWEIFPDPLQFLEQLKLKAQLERDFWHPELKMHRFSSTSFSMNYANI